MDDFIKNKFLRIDWDQKRALLILNWSTLTFYLSNDELKELFLKASNIVRKHQVAHVIINALKFNFVMDPELQQWVANYFNCRMPETALKKVIIVIPKGYLAKISIQQTVEEITQIRYSGVFQIDYVDSLQAAEEH